MNRVHLTGEKTEAKEGQVRSEVLRATEREDLELGAESSQDFLTVCSVQRGLGQGAWDEMVATSQFSKAQEHLRAACGSETNRAWELMYSGAPRKIAHRPKLALSNTSDFFGQI